MLVRHVSDLTGPSSGAFCTSCIRRLRYVVIHVLLDTSSCYLVTAGRVQQYVCILLDCIYRFPAYLTSSDITAVHRLGNYQLWVLLLSNILIFYKSYQELYVSPGLTFINSTWWLHYVYVSSKQTVTFVLYSINSLTLYAPCIILQHVYKPTRCTEFL